MKTIKKIIRKIINFFKRNTVGVAKRQVKRQVRNTTRKWALICILSCLPSSYLLAGLTSNASLANPKMIFDKLTYGNPVMTVMNIATFGTLRPVSSALAKGLGSVSSKLGAYELGADLKAYGDKWFNGFANGNQYANENGKSKDNEGKSASNKVSNDVIAHWSKDTEKARQKSIKYVIPQEVKDYYVKNNYAALVSDLKKDPEVQSIKKQLFTPDMSRYLFDHNLVDNDTNGDYLKAMLGEGLNGYVQHHVELKEAIDPKLDLDPHQFLDTTDTIIVYNHGKLQATTSAIYTVKGYNDSKQTRGQFDEDPIGWPKNTKLTNHDIGGKTYSGWLWNRSHLIGDRFGGPAIAKNAITGTRTQNVGDNSAEGGGMLFVENAINNFFKNDKAPFLEAYAKTGKMPIFKVTINTLPRAATAAPDTEYPQQILNQALVYKVELVGAKLQDKSDTQQFLFEAPASSNLLNSYKQCFNYVYGKYDKQNRFYDELFSKGSVEVIIPNIIKGFDIDYDLNSGVKAYPESEIRQ